MDAIHNWKEEKRSAYLYRILSEIESNPVHRILFLELSQAAEKQAGIWEKQMDKVPAFYPNRRTRFLVWLIKRMGAKPLRLALSAMKVRGMSIYHYAPTVTHVSPSGQLIEEKHRGIKSVGNLRAAVFGVSDGLLSNASLIFGIAGAHVSHPIILLSGLAGLLAGAFSMGAGEYISVSSQRDMLTYQLALEKDELDTYPEEEAAELALIYEARGLTKEEAEKAAKHMIQNPEKALDTLAREELGINPGDLGSPYGAAISSFVSFTIGAFIPLFPFFYGSVQWGLGISVGLTAIAFFAVGAILSLFSQRNAWWSGLRMLLMGATIGIITYLIGSLFGVFIHH